jgi:hypothetical protein
MMAWIFMALPIVVLRKIFLTREYCSCFLKERVVLTRYAQRHEAPQPLQPIRFLQPSPSRAFDAPFSSTLPRHSSWSLFI